MEGSRVELGPRLNDNSWSVSNLDEFLIESSRIVDETLDRLIPTAADEPQRFRASGCLRDDGGRLLLAGRRV